MNRTKLIRTGATLLLSSPLFAGCIFTMADDSAGDGNGDSAVSDTDVGDDTGVSSNADTNQGDDSSSDDSGNVDETDGGTTDGPVGECSETRIVDGGFEAGTPSTAWTEASDAFGTPICDTSCTTDEGAGPYAGDWYAWFGGVAEVEHASVTQHVTIDGTNAYLSFRFEINASAGTGDDVFSVTVDDQTVFTATDLEIDDYASYTPISIDVSDFADGADHVVQLKSEHAGTGMTSFFADEVALVSCDDAGGSSGSDDGSGSGDDSGGSSDGGATDDSGGSSDGGATDSGGSSDSGSTGM